jgi:hypothetical protein
MEGGRERKKGESDNELEREGGREGGRGHSIVNGYMEEKLHS